MGFWPIVLNVLRNSNVVLLLVDARMPTEMADGRWERVGGEEIARKVKKAGKRLVYVFNKIDLVGRKDVEALKAEYPDGFFVSCKRKRGVGELKKFLEKMADEGVRSSLRVGVVGYPNVGKSSLINLLALETRAKVGVVSGTTRKTQWIRVGRLRIMDSPGVIPFWDSGVEVGVKGGKDVHKIREIERVAYYLLEKNGDVIKKYYDVEGDGIEEIFEAIGRKRGYLVRGGGVDDNRTAVRIVDDWQKGRISLK